MDPIWLTIGIVAVIAAIWWLVKKVVKLAFYAAVIGALAWWFYLR